MGETKLKLKLKTLTLWDFFNCFRNNQYNYLGYIHIPYTKGTIEYKLVLDFIKKVDKIAKPKFIPRFILRLLELYGNDNSIVRVRNRKLCNLSSRLLKRIRITDIKTKWHEHDLRIYGYFTEKIDELSNNLENEIYNLSDDTIKERDRY